ncbi:TPM domain-containing protein [Marivita sp. S6314]|uniref:TPM domain-containing protein n=1 Tax=Marivita sp. S6314 TaxID=2926406 RepID=UPI001FF4A4E6|nr:TPM domain-containing protein [Marivita sp. S6314]MCK0148499.1 TPM domain-containing protein [Marivita sp. S6314]
MLRNLLICLVCLCALPVLAQTYPDYTRTTITDLADLLSDAEEDALHARLTGVRQDTGIEFAVLTLPSQQPYAPETSMEAFATGLFNHWGIGDASRNDGILVLILKEDRAMRIELGAGYGRDWDRVAAEVINRSFLPAFSNDNYSQGITTGVEDVLTSIALPFSSGADAPSAGIPTDIIFVVIALLGAGLIVGRRWFGDVLTKLRRCPNCGRRTLSRKRNVLTKATRAVKGQGEALTRCSACSFRKRDLYTISPTRSSSGGSFGGGRSGGAGASGRW